MTISLLISDVDGTLVTKDKVLTARAQAAVRSLKSEQIKFAITSARPPVGMTVFKEALSIETPIAGFNGGVFVDPVTGAIMAQHLIDPIAARRSLAVILDHGLDAWVFNGPAWLIRDRDAPLVAFEQRTIAMAPTITNDLAASLDTAAKVMGVSEDYALVEKCESELRAALGGCANAVRSQPYYLDVTDTNANKGAVVRFLSKYLGVPRDEIASIGDMVNDVLMFNESGLSIAMGNATELVKRQATHITASCDDEGFAKAIEKLILGDGPNRRQ